MRGQKEYKTEAINEFFEAVLSLKSIEECYDFFIDVCTIKELIVIAQRYEVAKLLLDEKSYIEISKKSGASSATISRVNRSLSYGNGGYQMAIERTKEQKK